MEKKRIIIVGGGFGGVKCAGRLCSELGPQAAEVVLFDQRNHLVFSPLLAEVVGSSINSLDVVVPLRHLLPKVFCRTEEVRRVDFAGQEVEYTAEDGTTARLTYDHLVLAGGNAANLAVVPGMADHAFPLKTVADAAKLRAHLMAQMERAEVAAQPERRDWHLTVLVVGAGYSGVEAAGEINDLLRGSARYFRRWKASDVKVVLIHSRDQILPEISPELREFARRKMERAGVTMRLNARVTSVTPDGVGLQDGQFLSGGTILCTIGSGPTPLIAGLDAPKEKGRLVTEPDLRLKGKRNVWALGDCAWVINGQDGQPSPTTGQFAERQGTQCGQNIVRILRGEATKPFGFKALGELCSIGGHSAVADLFGIHLSGFLAWFVWRGVYLFKLPTIGRRLQVGFDWATLLVFPRDLAYVETEPTERVSHAHYEPGDYVFRKGDAPTNFYVLEQGEVEVLRDQNGCEVEVVTVLGAGSFFGERSLIGNRPRVMSIRARTAIEVLVLGKNVFTQMSSALKPLRDALAQALNRRAADVWKHRPEVHDWLKAKPITELMEPVPQPLLPPTLTLAEVGHAFLEHNHEFFYASSDGLSLDGVVTITDLIRGQARSTESPITLADVMTRNPVAVCAQDDCAVAATVIREYRLKSLPVVESKASRKLVGCIRVRRIMAYVAKQTRETKRQIPLDNPPSTQGGRAVSAGQGTGVG
jgi:NADH:ubiquinone reductase (H+-translocating)